MPAYAASPGTHKYPPLPNPVAIGDALTLYPTHPGSVCEWDDRGKPNWATARPDDLARAWQMIAWCRITRGLGSEPNRILRLRSAGGDLVEIYRVPDSSGRWHLAISSPHQKAALPANVYLDLLIVSIVVEGCHEKAHRVAASSPRTAAAA